LLEHGADLNARYDHNSTPLHWAAQYGRVELVQVLLEHVVNLSAKDDHRKTANQVVSEYINARNDEGKTPLYLASQGPNYDRNANMTLSLDPLPNVVRLLLKHDADMNARENVGSTPLHVAARNGRVEIVRVLLENVANRGGEDDHRKTAIQVVSDYVNDRNAEGKTPLYLASQKGRVEIVHVLLEHGAIVGAKDNGGVTALQVASNDMIKKLLIEHGAS